MSAGWRGDVRGAAPSPAPFLPLQPPLYPPADRVMTLLMQLRDVSAPAHDVGVAVRVRRRRRRRLHVDLDLRVELDALGVDLQQAVGPVEQPQLAGLVLLLSLLPPQRHLGRHHALPLGDEGALGAHAVPPAAVALVALQGRHHPVVPTASALRGAGVAVRRPEEDGGGC